ncbi:glutathione peroxidase gpx1, partial [Ascosphaera pollenicola]
MASPQAMEFYDFEPKDAAGNPFPLHKLKGQVVLIANTASKCGFTPQYKGLEALYADLTSQYPGRFTILAFPCNQFGNQESADNSEIQTFCERNYGVTFPVLGKVDVNGEHAEPVFTWLKGRLPGLLGMKRIKWNFEKFLVDGEGRA